MERIAFLVQGSASDPYEVAFIRDGTTLRATCTCPAFAKQGKHCKHRVAIPNGSTKGIVRGNVPEAETVVSWLPGTRLGEVLAELTQAERVANEAQRAARSSKSEVARIMLNGQ